MKTTIASGVVAGLVAGILATGIKTVWEMGFPVREKSAASPPVVLADRALKAAGQGGLAQQYRPLAEGVIHWTFGILIGVTYGVVAAKYPPATVGYGLGFGLALYSVTHATVLPALHTEPWFFNTRAGFAGAEFTGHLAFGVTAEASRRFLSRTLANSWQET